MSWQARIEHTPAGLALTFGAPLSRLEMAPDVAAHLASLLAAEARTAGLSRPTPLAACGKQADKLSGEASLLAVEARHRMRGVVAAVANTEELRGFHHGGENLNGSELCCTVQQSHPLCCDCEPCLNGHHHG